LPNFLIGCLADYFGIEKRSTWDKLDALAEKKILNAEAVRNLKEALSAITYLRIRCHLHYGWECDRVCPSMQVKNLDKKYLEKMFILPDNDFEKMVEIYRVLFPLHRIFNEACKTQDFTLLAEETFFDSSLLAQAKAYEKLYQYKLAAECCHQASAFGI